MDRYDSAFVQDAEIAEDHKNKQLRNKFSLRFGNRPGSGKRLFYKVVKFMKKIVRKLFHSKKAQSMVEMAIMMPLLLLMFFGIIEFGFMLGSYMLIHDLARDGVRAGVVGADKVAIENYIKDEDRAFLLDTEKITVETWVNDTMPDNYTNRKVGDSLTVIVNYNYNLITPIISGIIGNSVSLPAKYVMRIEKT
ncbi:MAG TPA: hypothetical protein DER33_10540 [Syntrophomonas sp.]|jgi:hypothetical protein|nr:hypothetical protein [Syntrophomonas sp.]